MNNEHPLPSNKQLFLATFFAFMVAAILLVTVVLPAEYGIDKTGVGEKLGLTQMGVIKNQLAQEAAEDTQSIQPEEKSISISNIKKSKGDSSQTAQNHATRKITLKPSEAAEIKVTMNQGEVITYTWKVDKGHLNFDVHADKPGIKYFNYSKGKKVTGDIGNIIAEFTGKHGWFWRNRSEETVTVTLEIKGQFGEVIRVL